MNGTPWPVADFDPVRRLRVIAAGTPGAAVRETVVPASFEQVWSVAADLERTMPQWLPDIRAARLTPAQGSGRPQLLVTGRSRLRARFDLDLTPGWCLMRSRFLLGGMAAHPESATTTRFAFLGAFRLPAAGPASAVLRPLTDPLAARSLRRFRALVEAAVGAREAEAETETEAEAAAAEPVNRESVRAAILTSLDFANLDMEFPRIVHWLGRLPTADREGLMDELEAIAGTDPARRSDAAYLLDDLGLRRVDWKRGPAG